MEHQSFAALLNEAISKPGILSAAYRAFHNYSIGNQLAAMFQCEFRGIPIGPISTFQGWKAKGRHVSKGQKALELCMPITVKRTDTNAAGETEERFIGRFIWKRNWFVIAQTEGEDFAHEAKTPDWNAQRALAALEISQVAFTYPNGNCQGYASGRTIAINPVAALPHKTRFHELAHIVLGHTLEHTMTDSELTPRDLREVEAESVAYILCSILELPGLEDSRGYIQHWISGDTIPEKSAQKIFAAANKILRAGQPEQARAE